MDFEQKEKSRIGGADIGLKREAALWLGMW
jgi:hypothetical protein